MSASITDLGNNTFRMTLRNKTLGQVFTKEHRMVGAIGRRSSAEWVVESVGMRLSPFGQISFFNARAQQAGGALKPALAFNDITRLYTGPHVGPTEAVPTGFWSPSSFAIRQTW